MGDQKVTFDYDYMGRRWRKRVFAWDTTLNGGAGGWPTLPTVERKFVYDGWNVIKELRWDAAGCGFFGCDVVARRYVWGLDMSGLNGNPSPAGIHGAGGISGLLAMEDVEVIDPEGMMMMSGPATGGGEALLEPTATSQPSVLFSDGAGSTAQMNMLDALADAVIDSLADIATTPGLLRSFFRYAGLKL